MLQRDANDGVPIAPPDGSSERKIEDAWRSPETTVAQ
jgi:hypothetical protein